MTKCNKYVIRATENHGGRRDIHTFLKKRDAIRKLSQILSPPKSRLVNGKRIFLTSYRNAQSGVGINNPRIKKIRGYC